MFLIILGYDKTSIRPRVIEFVMAGILILPLTIFFGVNANNRIKNDIKENRVLDYVIVTDKEISKTRSTKATLHRYLLSIKYDYNNQSFSNTIDVTENKFKTIKIGDTIMIEFSATNPNFVKHKEE